LQNQFDDEVRRKGKAPAKNERQEATMMWVEKYRPKKFADLLGEDVSFDMAVMSYVLEGAEIKGRGSIEM
jgi:hypothetical protein